MSKNEVKKPSEGENISEKTKKPMQQCEYCDNWFLPKRRFVQKYCSNSCRVMAWNNPQGKKTQINTNDPEKSNKEEELITKKQNNIVEMQESIKVIVKEAIKETVKEEIMLAKKELLSEFQKRSRSINLNTIKILNRQQYHMLISGIAPLIAEPVRKMILNLFETNQPPSNIQEFLNKVSPLIKDLDPELKLQLLNVAKGFYDTDKKNNDTEQQGNKPN